MPDRLLPPFPGQLGILAGPQTAMATAVMCRGWGEAGISGTRRQRGQGCSTLKAPSEHSKQVLKLPPAHPPSSSTAAAPGALPRHGAAATASPLLTLLRSLTQSWASPCLEMENSSDNPPSHRAPCPGTRVQLRQGSRGRPKSLTGFFPMNQAYQFQEGLQASHKRKHQPSVPRGDPRFQKESPEAEISPLR